MKFGCGALLLILIQCIDMFLYANSISLKLRKREIGCPEGEYHAGTHCCKFCKPGTYAKDDCTEEHGKPDCQRCEAGHYMDADNGLKMCHKCSNCDNALGQEVLQACTESKNTVCRCKETYFCSKNESESNGCTECDHCTECDYGDAVPCTATKDAVCKLSRNHFFVPISAALVLILVVLGFYLQLPRNDNKDNSGQFNGQPFSFPDELKDIDLTGHLAEFSQKMDVNTVLLVVRKMYLSEAKIDAIKHDYANNHDEQKYQLLSAWYDSQGRTGAFQRLIRTLLNNKKRVTAEELINITRSHREQSQG